MENTKEDKLIDYKWEGKIQERFMGTIFWPGNIYKVLEKLAVSQCNESLFCFVISGVSLGSSRGSERNGKGNRHDTP